MNCRPVKPRCLPCRQSGAALVVALLVFALCTTLIVAMKSEFDRFYQRGANLLQSEQAYAYLRGAEDLAGMALLADYDQDKTAKVPQDTLREIWAQPSTPYPLDDGGWLTGSLQDLQGRFNLNWLIGSSVGSSVGAKEAGGTSGTDGVQPRFSAAQEQFIRLLQALEEVPVSQQEAITIMQAVTDWLDEDGEPGPGGAEDDYYYSRTPAHRAANRPMASVSELRSVAYMTPEIFQALRPLVTVWPQAPAPLNIHTAPVAVLRSINVDKELDPLSASDAQSLADYRENAGYTGLDEFLENPAFAGRAQQMAGMKPLLGEKSSYFLLEAEVQVADRRQRLYSILQRHRRQITSMARAGGSL